LLHAVPDGMVVVPRFNDGDRDVRLVIENVVSELRLPSGHHPAPEMDLTLGEVHFLTGLGVVVRSTALHSWRVVFGADVRLAIQTAVTIAPFYSNSQLKAFAIALWISLVSSTGIRSLSRTAIAISEMASSEPSPSMLRP
jgi:hypothetical protein